MTTKHNFWEVQHCRTFGNRYFKIKMEQDHYQLSRYNTDSLLLSLPFNQRESHARNSLMYINNIQNHIFCMLLASYPFRLRICIGTGDRTIMRRTFRPRKIDFTFKIQQDLSAKVCNTPLDSLIYQFYLFRLLSGNQ